MRTLMFILFAACRSDDKLQGGTDSGSVDVDVDGDGYTADEDCDDNESSINAGATELCDGLDNNCDGQIDEGVTQVFYADSDNDGYGNENITTEACESPSGFVSNGSDCDDTEADTYPGGEEICDGIDNNCDGSIDEGLEQAFYTDADGDGFGDATLPLTNCSTELGVSPIAGDCDDSDPAISPFANEQCDGIDNNCDGQIDEGVAQIFYADSDNDGYGDADTTVEACDSPEGYVQNTLDCNDTDTAVSPSADEYCDGIDNDCDGSIDEDFSVDASIWYADADSDGYGDEESIYYACSQPDGYSADNRDCDDSNNTIHPSVDELCNGVDDNCDGQVDEEGAIDALTWYEDGDSDGFGDATETVSACAQPSGYVSDDSDCDDHDDDIHPGAAEICNAEDDDCDGDIDSDAIDRLTYYLDGDSDGYGDTDSSTASCTESEAATVLSGAVSLVDGDCDDSTDSINPDASELCDSIDNNCDGGVDEDTAIDALVWYVDGDEDGYGDPNSTQTSCSTPTGHVSDATDCDDNNNSIHPTAEETCDSIDEDCNGIVDDNPTDGTLWYADIDLDGFGNAASSAIACDQPTGYVSDATDCNDLSNSVYPGASEFCNSIDDNCDGTIDEGVSNIYYADVDLDGYGDADSSITACTMLTGYVSDSTDCDDGDDGIHPNATELCDDIDQDCDGNTSSSACDNCAGILDQDSTSADGIYTVNPDGNGEYDVYCDMTTDGGGWTMVANISDAGSDVWSQFMPAQDAGIWEDTNPLGIISLVDDYKSQAFMDVDATDILIKESGSNVLFANNCWSEQSFQEFMSGLSWEGDGSDTNWTDSTGAHLCDFEHFGYNDTVLRAASNSGSNRVLAFKWGERDGVQDGNKDRTMITTYRANGHGTPYHIDLPTGLGGFTSYSGNENYEDANECQGDGPDQCSNAEQNYQLYVR